MEEDPKNEDILIAHSTIDVQAIHDDHHEIHDQSIIVEEQGKDVGKEEVGDNSECDLKSRTLQQISEENVSTSTMDCYSVPSMVESDLSSSVCPIEPMDQSPSLPRLAMAPVPDDAQNALQSECDEINQAWFTTKEDKDSLQGKDDKDGGGDVGDGKDGNNDGYDVGVDDGGDDD
ncbi:Hypothetical predicted protein [Paramuricea clavata]|uniref:Cyclin-D-binding Myb-like transcription factor 1 N-terminal domain-containing protein n=1 Tax=Paramuricea clavata TaxID=317549 RepID=A0A6S7LGC6_PARCT|nr:Hypothetical predicted protein [Paramuricea clavata]